MRNLVYILIIVFTILACHSKNSNSRDAVYKIPLDSAGIAFKAHHDSVEKALDTLDFWGRVDLLTAEGNYILVRGADRDYDTIIDHFRYRFTTEE